MTRDSRPPATGRLPADRLIAFGQQLLHAAGQPSDRAQDVAEVLVEGDLLGHTTHGLSLLPLYLEEIARLRMPTTGEPTVIADQGSAVTWDGGYLPGPWLLRKAVALALERLQQHPLAVVVIRRAHHLACLQTYLRSVAESGVVILLTCTDPANRWVVPPGGTKPQYSPNPIAAGIPTTGEPHLIDISLSTTAAGTCVRAAKAGERLPGPWLADAQGQPTDDPRPLVDRQEGGLYPLGGFDLGYKGFGLALIMEALTSALCGHGRSDGNAQWGSSVFLMLIDPARFGGREAFARETSFLAEACRQTPTPEGGAPVRLPGEAALARRREQLAHGVALHPSILPALQPWADQLGVAMPASSQGAGRA